MSDLLKKSIKNNNYFVSKCKNLQLIYWFGLNCGPANELQTTKVKEKGSKPQGGAKLLLLFFAFINSEIIAHMTGLDSIDKRQIYIIRS